MVKGKESILNFAKQSNAPYWTVFHYSGDKSNFICKQEDVPNLSMDVAMEKLESYLNYMQPGRYRLVLKKNYADNKGFTEMGIELVESSTSSPSGSAPINFTPGAPMAISGLDGKAQMYVPQDHVSLEISKALQAYEEKKEKEALAKKLAELEKENALLKKEAQDDVIGRILTKVEPHLPLFFDALKITSPNSTISGHMNEKTTTAATPSNDQAATQQLTELIQSWEDQFPGDPIQVIAKVVSIMKESPTKYTMYRNMLLS